MPTINARTDTYCVIGYPTGHSLSPVIHQEGFRQHALNAVYLAHDLPPGDLAAGVEGLKALGYRGFNVTYPHKHHILPLLDDLSPQAAQLEAVNTVSVEKGRLIGHNTDGDGFLQGLLQQTMDPAHRNIAVLGAGGVAASVALSLARHGPCRLILCNRTLETAEQLKNRLMKDPASLAEVTVVTPDQLTLDNVDLLVHTTPVGMGDDRRIPFGLQGRLHAHLTVADLIYHPHETPLLQEAKRSGCRVHHGIHMLIGQAALAFFLWTGKELDQRRVADRLAEKNVTS